MAGRILASLQDRIGTKKFHAWFRHGTRLALDEGQIAVAVPNPFIANWIESHYVSELSAAAEEHIGQQCPVTVTVDPSLNADCRKRTLDIQAEIVNKATSGTGRPRKRPQPVPPRYRLEDFIVGESNKLAYSAAVTVASGASVPFNPLFVHGPCGVGKTHLLQGICNAVARRSTPDRPLRWRYVTAEAFTNDFVGSLRRKQLDKFRDRYRGLDLLAIDDVHFLSAKKATQDEFLHTFNAIQTAGHQVVLASDAHPRMVGELNEQLTSRFMAGMVVKMDAPDRATRLAILGKRAEAMKLKVDRDVLEYVASHVHGSVRELEGGLIKLAALAALESGRVTMKLASDALADHLARSKGTISLSDIEAVVAAYFGVTPADLHSTRRTKTVSAARMTAMYLARKHTNMSFPEIGRHMGKNHSSVVLAVQRMQRVLNDGNLLEWVTPAGKKTMQASALLEMLSEQLN
jgi:chromosomal replication initiator protein